MTINENLFYICKNLKFWNMKNIIILLLILVFASCKTPTKNTGKTNERFIPEPIPILNSHIMNSPAMLPPAIIYKTTVNYNDNVPVIMNESRTEIISYPAPTDLRRSDGYCTPTPLSNGFLLDNRGINSNVAFTNYTYKEYAALENAPTMTELMSRIVNKYPLEIMYQTLQTRNNKTGDRKSTRLNSSHI